MLSTPTYFWKVTSKHSPIKAPRATKEPIQLLSSDDTTELNGESFNSGSSNFDPTGLVQPSVVPTAIEDRLTKLNKFILKLFNLITFLFVIIE
jgi:hypothetical protein